MRRLSHRFTSKIAAAFIVLGASAGASGASANVCSTRLTPEQEVLGETAGRGEAWAGPSTQQVHLMRFRVRPNCAIEVFVQGWGWREVVESPEIPGSYEVTYARNWGSEVLDLRFRFTGSASMTWIEAESWYHSPLDRSGNGQPRHVIDTLFH